MNQFIETYHHHIDYREVLFTFVKVDDSVFDWRCTPTPTVSFTWWPSSRWPLTWPWSWPCECLPDFDLWPPPPPLVWSCEEPCCLEWPLTPLDEPPLPAPLPSPPPPRSLFPACGYWWWPVDVFELSFVCRWRAYQWGRLSRNDASVSKMNSRWRQTT